MLIVIWASIGNGRTLGDGRAIALGEIDITINFGITTQRAGQLLILDEDGRAVLFFYTSFCVLRQWLV